MGKLVYEIIPFNNFKEKIKLTKQYSKYPIEIYKNYLIIRR